MAKTKVSTSMFADVDLTGEYDKENSKDLTHIANSSEPSKKIAVVEPEAKPSEIKPAEIEEPKVIISEAVSKGLQKKNIILVKKNDSARLTLRLPQDLYDTLRLLAYGNFGSINGVIVRACEDLVSRPDVQKQIAEFIKKFPDFS